MTNKERIIQNNLDLGECLELAEALPDKVTGVETQEKVLEVTADGSYEVLPDAGKALSKVTVNVDTPDEKEEQEKSLDITADGSYTVAPDSGKVLKKVTVNVDTPDKKEEQEKAITVEANGEYAVEPDEGKALSKVTVSVSVVSSAEVGLAGIIDRSMVEIEVPSEVASIGPYAFAGCTSCLRYDFSKHESIPVLTEATAFDGINDEAKIYVPGALYREWIRAAIWKDYALRIEAVGEIPPLTPAVGLAYSYDGTLGGYICTGRGECTDKFLVIPDKYDDGVNGEALVLQIGANAFQNDLEIVELVLPSHGAIHDSRTFMSCTNLERVENCYAAGTHEGQFAFYGCSKLAHVHFIKDGYISSFMFENNANPATYDFTDCTAVLSIGSLSNNISTGSGTQYLVPAALYDEWCAATNWTEYSHLIVAV